jgi:hypothetical protein
VSATAGWYPDPGGGQGLYRYWDGQAWSAATTANPASAPPPQGIVNPGSAAGTSGASAHANYGQGSYGQGSYGQGSYGGAGQQGGYGQGAYGGGRGSQPLGGQPGQPAYLQYQSKKRSGVGWWIGAAALALVLVVVGVVAIRAATSGGGTAGGPSGTDTSSVCPPEPTVSQAPPSTPADGRVHGGPLSYPQLGEPWGAPRYGEDRVPFGSDVVTQSITVEPNYAPDSSWVASVLVGELQAGDGFFTPEQGSQIVVRCILGKFYGNNPVNSDVVQNKATTIDGKEAWIVESKLTFDIPNLQTKGERLIVAIVQATPERSGLFYASIPDTTPQLLQPARDALKQLQVDG